MAQNLPHPPKKTKTKQNKTKNSERTKNHEKHTKIWIWKSLTEQMGFK